MEKFSEQDRVEATGIALAIATVVHGLHNTGIIKCPGLAPDVPLVSVQAIGVGICQRAMDALENHAATSMREIHNAR